MYCRLGFADFCCFFFFAIEGAYNLPSEWRRESEKSGGVESDFERQKKKNSVCQRLKTTWNILVRLEMEVEYFKFKLIKHGRELPSRHQTLFHNTPQVVLYLFTFVFARLGFVLNLLRLFRVPPPAHCSCLFAETIGWETQKGGRRDTKGPKNNNIPKRKLPGCQLFKCWYLPTNTADVGQQRRGGDWAPPRKRTGSGSINHYHIYVICTTEAKEVEG